MGILVFGNKGEYIIADLHEPLCTFLYFNQTAINHFTPLTIPGVRYFIHSHGNQVYNESSKTVPAYVTFVHTIKGH